MTDSQYYRPDAAGAAAFAAAPPEGRLDRVHGSDLRLGLTRFGPRVQADGTVFRLWAPGLPATEEAVELLVEDRRLAMIPSGDGWFEALAPDAGPGSRYAFRIGDLVVPDPASRRQDDDVGGRSVVVKPSLGWGRRRLGRAWTEAVVAEVHVGTVTPEGTFRGLIERLPHFVDAGFTAIELMPVAEFPGRRGWGYDGVLLFAPEAAYGTPDDLAALVDAAHRLGLSIILDVVYNHFGPTGNHLSHYAPGFFDTATPTPWGPAIDLTVPEVRRFFIENALHWVDGYGFDGLRFDAVHALQGPGRADFLAELSEALNALDPAPHLILENEHNEARLVGGGPGETAAPFRAQWNDDFHHVFHVAVTGEQDGYYAAYAEAPLAQAARVLAEGFAYQGDPNPLRDGVARGEPSSGRHPTAFVSFVQNHDQIGNRALGDRLTELASPEAVRLLRFVTLLAPQVPMLFMGEEFESRRPFRFFCDYAGEMAEAVRSGRRAEFASFAAFSGEEVPDPVAPETFEASRLDWERLHTPHGREALGATRDFVELRRRHVSPLLATPFRGGNAWVHGGMISAVWRFEGGSYGLELNMTSSARFARLPVEAPAGTVGTVTPGPGHWLFEPYAGALWIPS